MDNNYELDLYERINNVKLNREGILECVQLFMDQAHSGFSASYALDCIKSLQKHYDKTIDTLNKLLKDEDPYGMQRLITNNILEVHNAFIAHELSEEEIKIAISLMQFHPITPLTGEEDEWEDISDFDGDKNKRLQNKRFSSVFKLVCNNGIEIAYHSGNDIFSDDGGRTFYSTGTFGRKQIAFPYEIPEEPEKTYLFYSDEKSVPFILTDKETIAKLNKLNEKESLKED